MEFGCGTGQFTLEAAAVCDAVVAVDVSPVMLRGLTAKLSERGVTNVDVEQAGFLTYEHDGALPTSSIPASRSTTCQTSGRP